VEGGRRVVGPEVSGAGMGATPVDVDHVRNPHVELRRPLPLWRIPAVPPGPAALVVAGGAALLTAWLLLARLLGPQVIPGPLAVVGLAWADAASGTLPYHLGITMVRVTCATVLALAFGGLGGLWIGLSSRADSLWAPWLVTGLAVPRLLVIVVIYLLLGLNDVAAIVATALAVAPAVTVTMRDAVRAADWKLVDMARAFSVPPARQWREVIWPQLLPYATSSARNALSLGLKMMLFVELMGRPSGLGYQISFYFQMFNMGQVLAYGLAAVVVAALLELAMRAAEKRAYRWRPLQEA
jgi:NitT/TauT family transport system permease protein